ncbi:hypothetical protein CC86DRAFT_342608 [Ophiobolus disseminans]|uniref:Uncharacterized protein n=1 Tax=Ophiobolus disseminans TaxID=1469910 RepID=A0A6A7AFI2_9PLEO|nr:hypothetical protein CC86DRAFT_342608 [Ophiobolus disseminans]
MALDSQSPPRIPRLKYRNPLPTIETSVSPEASRNSETQHSSAQEPPASPFPKPPSDRPSIDTASLTSPSLASTTSSVLSNGSRSSSKTKKKSSVLGFLSLKEPSQLALEQYAEAQRKQASDSGSSTPTSASRPDTSYSTKKLPRNVPKVNSKWDGVPEAVGKHRHSRPGGSGKNRPSESTQGSQKSRFSTLSWNDSKISVMTDGTRNPPNSLASAAPSVSNLTIRGDARSPSPSPSTATLPEMSYYFPEPLAGDEQSRGTVAYRPPANEVPPRPSESSSDFNFHPERADSPASSADSMETVVKDAADMIFNKLNDRPHKSIWGDTSAPQTPSASDEVAVPESHDFLFSDQPESDHVQADSLMTTSPLVSSSISHYAPPRPMQNFSRPTPPSALSPPARLSATPSYRTSRTSSGLPTLYEASLASTESDETIQDDDDDEDDDAYSIAPSTIAPSVLSSRWLESPRERLGLGGRLRMNGGLPWDDQKEPPGKPKKNRLSMFSKGSSRS